MGSGACPNSKPPPPPWDPPPPPPPPPRARGLRVRGGRGGAGRGADSGALLVEEDVAAEAETRQHRP